MAVIVTGGGLVGATVIVIMGSGVGVNVSVGPGANVNPGLSMAAA